METNYELKHKCLLVPLKAVLLVIAMVLVGFTTYAQQGESVKVANNQQLIEAMGNPSIGTIELEAGYYEYLNTYLDSGSKVKKSKDGNGSRAGQCTYFIIERDVCFYPTNPVDVAPPNTPGFTPSIAEAGTRDDNVPLCGCCPPAPGNIGLWTVVSSPALSTVNFMDPLNNLEMDFEVNLPGVYTLKYTWPAPYNSNVQTEYIFYGIDTLELSADDVCGLTTWVDFNFEMPDLLEYIITWTLNGAPFTDTVGVIANEGFQLTVDECGLYELSVIVNPIYQSDTSECYDTATIIIDFSCEPTADAGLDVNVCDNLCYYSLVGSTGLTTYSPNFAWSWVQLDGPGDLVFDDEFALVTSVCAEDPICAYGEYEVQFQVQNGLCYDEDEMFLRFYEMPVADAGDDLNLCNTFSFDLAALPYSYCGVEGTNYWKHAWWELVSQPDPACTVTFDELDPATSVAITTCGPCPYGDYVFVWHELNVKVVGADTLWAETICYASDEVVISIFETPAPNAGPDVEYCETDILRLDTLGHSYAVFALDGTEDLPCNLDMAYTFFWSVGSQPDACNIVFTADAIDPEVTISNCSTCPYGVYEFILTQQNGYFDDAGAFISVCESTDEVTVTIYEQPTDVDAGDDLLLCDDFAFSLTATGSDYECTPSNWYSWTLVSQPVDADCEVTITNGTTLTALVTVAPCNGICAYGEYVFRFTEYNGSADVYCEDWDEVMVTIFEQPVADAGDDVDACVDLAFSPFCYDLDGNMDYCYSMYGTWTKSCGPGAVTFTDVNDPMTEVCFTEPGRFKLTWTLTNGAEDCEDDDEVIFDLLEQPVALGEVSELQAPCDDLCIDLGLVDIVKYDYFGTDAGECPNFTDMAHWSYVDGPCSDPNSVTFADDTDPATELCVSYYGAYTVRWTEVNVAVDGDSECLDSYDVFVEFYETPEPFAGDDDAICGNCYTLQGIQYDYLGGCNQHLSDYYYWESLSTNPCPVTFSDFESLTPLVCIQDDIACYGTYGFVLHEANGNCYGSDTVYICFSDVPGDVAVCFSNNPNDCGPWENSPTFIYGGCLQPNEVLEVCAEGCTDIYLGPWCDCLPGFDWNDPALYGYTFEWSLISPAGTIVDSEPGWYDFVNGQWNYPWIYICWGECCDTARLYLTITGPEGDCGLTCENTMEYKFYVNHKPCVNIEGPDVSEVDAIVTYCNVCPPEFDQSCLLYTWTAEHCGEIVSGQGTECIEVLWTDYNINGGWGEITLTVFDTCTGCCNYDEMLVKIWPTGTLGNATLSGHVKYHNGFNTPLNGVEIQLWNGGIPVMSTTSFNDIEGGNGVGYYEFPGVSAATNFGITATYDAPWYGANATDALAVELKTINNLPGGFTYNALVGEAMDVNNNTVITATDALWIKQRAISMVNYFPAGNWVFYPGMSSIAGTYDIMTLNAGDANRSNIPNSMKSAPAIDLVNDGTLNVVTGQVFELPIRIANAHQFGAMTLNLGYNSALLEVVDVVPVEGMIDNISNGNVSIAWSNVNPMVLEENDVVVTLKVKTLGEITATESMFSIGMGSEFADQSASVIEPVTLKAYGITTAAAASNYFLSTNRPNPFNTSTFIEYTMPETGKVKLSVLDMLGQEIAVLVDATQTAGSYTVEFSAAGLATGVYIYKITVDGESRDFISTQRMVISH